jgi:hypothetical protein
MHAALPMIAAWGAASTVGRTLRTLPGASHRRIIEA